MKIIRNMPPHFSVRYPWPVWTDGQARVAEHGVDYLCSDTSFGNALRNHARRHGLKVRQHITEGTVAFQFRPPDCPGATEPGTTTTCGNTEPHEPHEQTATPEAMAEHAQVVRRNPHILAPGLAVPPNSGMHRHDGERCLDGCDPTPLTDPDLPEN